LVNPEPLKSNDVHQLELGLTSQCIWSTTHVPPTPEYRDPPTSEAFRTLPAFIKLRLPECFEQPTKPRFRYLKIAKVFGLNIPDTLVGHQASRQCDGVAGCHAGARIPIGKSHRALCRDVI
jgi:hypothetical protein